MIRPGTLAETTVSSSPKSVPTTSTLRWTGSFIAGTSETGTVVAVRVPRSAGPAWVFRSHAVSVVAANVAAAVETATMSIYARQQMIDSAQFGYGSAVSVMIILIIMIFVVAYVTALRTKP